MPVVVLGMHRSGTSAAARVVNLLGVPMGTAEDLMAPTDDNPKGYWESEALRQANDVFLDTLGGAWDAPPSLDPGWFRGPQWSPLVEQAREMFRMVYGDAREWAWKDPRLCLLLPFWRQALQVDPVAIVVQRHPLEVWRSLERRDGTGQQEALALWERYTRGALLAATDLPTFVLPYHGLLADPSHWAGRLGAFLASHGIALTPQPDAAERLAEFLDPSLRHAAYPAEQAAEDEALSRQQAALWRLLDAHAGENDGAPEPPPESPWVAEVFALRRSARLAADRMETAESRAWRLRAYEAKTRVLVGAAPPPTPRCTIVIPTFNNVDYTEACLRSIIAHTPTGWYRTVIVDNASTDGTRDLLAALEGNDVTVVLNERNEGFAHASNQGAALADTEFVLFMNNDIEAMAGWLEPLVAVLDEEPDVAAVGAKLLFPDGSVQHAGVVFVEIEGAALPLYATHASYRSDLEDPDVNVRQDSPAVTAAVMLVRRSVLEEAGGFDEGFWNGCEDVDLCLKIRGLGHRIVYQPASVLIHHESVSGPERFVKVSENERRLAERWGGKVVPNWLVRGGRPELHPRRAEISA